MKNIRVDFEEHGLIYLRLPGLNAATVNPYKVPEINVWPFKAL